MNQLGSHLINGRRWRGERSCPDARRDAGQSPKAQRHIRLKEIGLTPACKGSMAKFPFYIQSRIDVMKCDDF